MNILQQEDIIKGLADDRLMQEAQQPTGQVPQFLVVSEIQRRSDMRKRFEAQQEQPEGTVAEQIMNGGIGSLNAQQGQPPQQPQGMPQQPQGQPPQQGMAAGGITRMQVGGGTGMYGSQNAFGNNAYIPNDMDIAEYAKLKSQGYSDEEAQSALQTGGAGMTPSGGALGIDMPALPERSIGPQDRSEPSMGHVDLGLNKSTRYPDYPSMTAGHGDKLSRDQEAAGLLRQTPDGLPWMEASPSGIASLFESAPDEMAGSIDLDAIGGQDKEYDAGGFPGFMGDVWNQAKEQIFTLDPEDPIISFGDADKGIVAGAAAKSQAVSEAITAQGGSIKGTDGSKTKQLMDAGGAAKKGNTPLDLLMAQAGKSAGDLPDLSGLAGQQRKDAWSNALVQIGAGIAGGDISKGLSKAGDVMALGNRGAREIEMQQKVAEYKARQGDIDRDTGIYGKAAQIQATADVYARELMKQGRMDRRSVIQRAQMAVAEYNKQSMMVEMNPRKRMEESQRVYQQYLEQIASQLGVELLETDYDYIGGMGSMGAPQGGERPPLSDFN